MNIRAEIQRIDRIAECYGLSKATTSGGTVRYRLNGETALRLEFPERKHLIVRPFVASHTVGDLPVLKNFFEEVFPNMLFRKDYSESGQRALAYRYQGEKFTRGFCIRAEYNAWTWTSHPQDPVPDEPFFAKMLRMVPKITYDEAQNAAGKIIQRLTGGRE